MSKYLDAIRLSDNLKNRLEEIVLNDIQVRDSSVQNEINQIIKSEDGLISELLVEGAYSAKKHDTTLRNIPFLNKSFLNLLDLNKEFNPDFYPFTHQYETLKVANEMDEENKPALVVTAPTGAGKTEAFLLPLLNELISNPRQENEKGVRAIILYPMNALVADQNKRLFSYLEGQSKVKMFFYNSETPESARYATNEFDDQCFIQTRKEARDNPPDIMITNYSMLEYILARPNDYPLIGNALRTVIIDEAHLYTGTLAAEVSLLLRRVVAKSKVPNNEVLYIATTATISDDKEERQSFFSKFFNKENIISIAGEKEVREIDKTINVDDEIEWFKDITQSVMKQGYELHNELRGYHVFSKILKILSENYAMSFNQLMRLVSDRIDSQTLLNIFTIGAKARINYNELPLLPHKLHLQVRSAQGFSVCSNPNCPDSNIQGIGKIHHGIYYNCTTCKSPTLNLVRCSECGEHYFHGKFDEKDTLYLERFFRDATKSENSNILSFAKSSQEVFIDQNGKKCSAHEYNNRFYKHTSCHVCSNEEFYNLGVSDQFLIPLVSETVLANMPEMDKEPNVFLPAKGKRLLTFSDSRSEAARLGPLLTSQHETQLFRRILMHTIQKSISESENSDLREYYENEVIENEKRLATIDNTVVKQKITEKITDARIELAKMSKGMSISSLVETIKTNELIGEFFNRERMKNQEPDEREQLSYSKNKEATQKSIYNRVVDALITPNVKDVNLESLGLIKLTYPGVETIELSDRFQEIFANDFKLLQAKKEYLLNTFIYIFRDYKAITAEDKTHDIKDFELSKVVLGQYVAFDAKNKNIFNLKVTQRSSIYKYICSLLRSFDLEDTDENVEVFLRAIFETFLHASARDDLRWLEQEQMQTDDGTLTYAFRIVFSELVLDIPEDIYLNSINNTLWNYAVNDLIPEKKCEVKIMKLTQDELNKNSHFARYRNMYLIDSLELSMGLWAEEHSAQLASKENRRLQDLFIQGKRNVLSATTTLEVGIDIGGLTGVLMANVPPNKANYIQRSGRAGRRTDGSSMILTYAKTRHFDQNVFRDFNFYLEKPYKKLTISLEKEKITVRHFNSFMLYKFYESRIGDKSTLIFDSFKKMGYFVGVYEVPKYTENPYAQIMFEKDSDSIYESFILFLTSYKVSQDDMHSFDEIFKHTNTQINYSELIVTFKTSVEEIVRMYIKNVEGMYEDWNYATTTSHKSALRYNIKQKHNESLIKVFSNAQILPKYGFPIDVRTLQVLNAKNTFELSRGSFLALAEYVPGSKILAGGMLIESKGISKHFTGENIDEAFGKKGFIYTCDKGHFFTSADKKVHECSMKGCEGTVRPEIDYLMPEHGYITAASDKLSYKVSSPKKVGMLEVYSAVHTSSINDVSFSYDNFNVTYKEKAIIYGVNKGSKGIGFAVCTRCGYTESENEKVNSGSYDKLPTLFKKHASIYSESSSSHCLDHSPTIWRNHNLMAEMTTDAILLSPKHSIPSRAIARTIANALQLSGAEILGIDEREISALVQEVDNELNILLYDNQSGGVGYVYDLAKNRWNMWLDKTKKRLYIDEKHDEECLSGCIKCVVTMNTSEPLPRKETLDFLNQNEKTNVSRIKKIKKNVSKKEISDKERFGKFKKHL